MFKDPDESVRLSAVVALVNFEPDKVIPIFIDSLTDESRHVRTAIIRSIGKMAELDFKPPWRPSLTMSYWPINESDPDIPASPTFELEYPALVLALLKALKDKYPDVRRAAAFALRRFHGEDVYAGLKSAVRDKVSEVRQAAIRSIAASGNPEALGLLIQLLTDRDSEAREVAASCLKGFSGEALGPALSRAVRDRNARVRAAAILTLAISQQRKSVPVLMDLLKSRRERVRAAFALGLVRDYSVVPELLNWLETGTSGLQISAIMALTEMKVAAALPQLRRVLNTLPNKAIGNIRTFIKSASRYSSSCRTTTTRCR